MGRASRLTPAHLTAAIARERAGRPNVTAMTNEERRSVGLMTRKEAAEHEHLASIPSTRLAERTHGPVPDDIWAAGGESGE